MFIIRELLKVFIVFSLFCCVQAQASSENPQRFFQEEANKSDGEFKTIFRDALKSKKKSKKLVYFLYIEDFIKSFIEIPTSNVSGDSTTLESKYLAGRAPLYNKKNKRVGTCSASFLCMRNDDGIYVDIANYLSVDSGLIVTWFTPTRLLNLELDTILHSMVTECLVIASTKVGFNPFYGQTFDMKVSSDEGKIYFKLKSVD